MHIARSISVVLAGTTAIALASVAGSTLADDESRAVVTASHGSTYLEPAADRVRDGAYLGYVRLAGPQHATVAVDFVSHVAGTVRNRRPERLVEAGVLAGIGIFDSVGRPFRVVIQDDAVIQVQTADDVLPARRPATTS